MFGLLEVQCTERPSFAKWGNHRGVRGKGIRYERAFHAHAERSFGGCYASGVWFRYRREGNPKSWSYAQTDGLFFDFARGVVTVFEVKYKHTANAYFQLVDRYIPLLDFWLNREAKLWRFAPVEICHWYDKAIAYPTRVTMRENPLDSKVGDFSVHIWREE